MPRLNILSLLPLDASETCMHFVCNTPNSDYSSLFTPQLRWRNAITPPNKPDAGFHVYIKGRKTTSSNYFYSPSFSIDNTGNVKKEEKGKTINQIYNINVPLENLINMTFFGRWGMKQKKKNGAFDDEGAKCLLHYCKKIGIFNRLLTVTACWDSFKPFCVCVIIAECKLLKLLPIIQARPALSPWVCHNQSAPSVLTAATAET